MSEFTPKEAESGLDFLRYPEAWSQLLEDVSYANHVADLQAETQRIGAAIPEPPEWLDDNQEVRRRWQYAIEAAASLVTTKESEPIDVLRAGIDSIAKGLLIRGWETPGLGFRVLGYGSPDDRWDRDNHTELIDLRDMDIPKSVMDMSFEDFKQLTDAEIESLRVAVNTNLARRYIGNGNWGQLIPYQSMSITETHILRDFMTRRRFGTPDVELSRDDIGAYLGDLICLRRQKDESYGERPDSIDLLSEEQWESLDEILDYFLHNRDPQTDSNSLDTYSLKSTLGLTNNQINDLVDADVLQPLGSYQGPDGGLYATYSLTPAYFNYWWVSSLTAED